MDCTVLYFNFFFHFFSQGVIPFLNKFGSAKEFETWLDNVNDYTEEVGNLGLFADGDADDNEEELKALKAAMKQLSWLTNDYIHVVPRVSGDLRVDAALGPALLDFVRDAFQNVFIRKCKKKSNARKAAG